MNATAAAPSLSIDAQAEYVERLVREHDMDVIRSLVADLSSKLDAAEVTLGDVDTEEARTTISAMRSVLSAARWAYHEAQANARRASMA